MEGKQQMERVGGKEGEIFPFWEGGAGKLFPRGSHTGFVCPQVLF